MIFGWSKCKLWPEGQLRGFYAHAFKGGVSLLLTRSRCSATKRCSCCYPDGRARILSRRIEQTERCNVNITLCFQREINSISRMSWKWGILHRIYQPLKADDAVQFQNPTWYLKQAPCSNNMHMVNNVYGFGNSPGARHTWWHTK